VWHAIASEEKHVRTTIFAIINAVVKRWPFHTHSTKHLFYNVDGGKVGRIRFAAAIK